MPCRDDSMRKVGARLDGLQLIRPTRRRGWLRGAAPLERAKFQTPWPSRGFGVKEGVVRRWQQGRLDMESKNNAPHYSMLVHLELLDVRVFGAS